jgi:rhodanese-related sulfurtransferase
MTFKSKEKSFFDNAVDGTKEEIGKIEEKGTKKALKWYDFGFTKLRSEIKKHPAQYFFLFISTFFGSVVTTLVGLFVFSSNILNFFVPQEPQKVNGVQVASKEVSEVRYDPLLLASKLRNQDTDIEIVDIRNLTDYKNGHILHAKSVPVYDTSLVTKNGDLEEGGIRNAFRQYMATNKLLIIYAQNTYSTLPSDIASLLNSGGKNVKALAIGWEEWLHLQTK